MKRPIFFKGNSGLRLSTWLFGVVAFFCASGNAMASYTVCQPWSFIGRVGSWVATFNNVVDNPNIPIGGVLATATVVDSGTYPSTLSCTLVNGTRANGSSNLRPASNVDVPSYNINGASVRILYNGTPLRSEVVYRTYSAAGNYDQAPSGITAQLIKTSATTSLNNGFCSQLTPIGNLVASDGMSNYLAGIGACVNGFTRQTPTCTVNTGSVNIPLGNVAGSSFGGVGSFSTTSAAQNIALSCSYSPRVRMTLQGTQAAGGPNTTVALTGAGGAGVAQGIGVQILYGGNPLVVNSATPTVVSAAAGATLNVPIAARYYRTGTVTAGRANASPTLRFDYN